MQIFIISCRYERVTEKKEIHSRGVVLTFLWVPSPVLPRSPLIGKTARLQCTGFCCHRMPGVMPPRDVSSWTVTSSESSTLFMRLAFGSGLIETWYDLYGSSKTCQAHDSSIRLQRNLTDIKPNVRIYIYVHDHSCLVHT